MKRKVLTASVLVIGLCAITFMSCQKKKIEFNPSKSLSENSNQEKLDISFDEFNLILADLNSTNRAAPGWWENFKKWIKSHSGNAQQYVNGQPSCFGSGGCGPCAGICFGSIIDGGGGSGGVSESEFVLGLRALAFSIIEKNGGAPQKKMVIEIPDYEEDFVKDNKFVVNNDEYLPSFFATEAGLNSIMVKAGTYPAITSPQDGITRTIVNITAN